MSAAVFDKLASQYDRLWTHSTVGLLQREAVWRHMRPLLQPGQTALDLGCGTGEDALRLMRAGLRVRAIDASSEMVKIARSRGVDAESGAANPGCSRLSGGSLDVILSNFGVLNCIEDIESLGEPLALLVKPGGYLIVCVIGRFCLWETAWALIRRKPAKAFRRWRNSAMSSLGIRVSYPSNRRLKAAFHPYFTLLNWRGIGLSVPPSYVSGLPDSVLSNLDALDRRIAHWPILRNFADHRLFIFVRNSSCQ